MLVLFIPNLWSISFPFPSRLQNVLRQIRTLPCVHGLWI